VIANVALSVLDEHFAASRLDSRERAKTPLPWSSELPALPVRGRLVPGCIGHQGTGRGPVRGSEGGLGHDGFAPVARKDVDHPYRRGP
jgi:hypothetical protein